MEKHDNVRLSVIGYLSLPEALGPFAHRIDAQPFDTYERYLSVLAGMDINIIPLLNDRFNECKSAIRYLDASVVAVPTIASAVGDLVNVMSDDGIGLLARDSEEWEYHLDTLINSPDRRGSMAVAARKAALERHTTKAVAEHLDPKLKSILTLEMNVAA